MSVAEWYARYAVEGRAWLPRTPGGQRHWLVRFRDVTRQRERYGHCFADATTLHFYLPTTQVPGWARRSLDVEAQARQAAADGSRT